MEKSKKELKGRLLKARALTDEELAQVSGGKDDRKEPVYGDGWCNIINGVIIVVDNACISADRDPDNPICKNCSHGFWNCVDDVPDDGK